MYDIFFIRVLVFVLEISVENDKIIYFVVKKDLLLWLQFKYVRENYIVLLFLKFELNKVVVVNYFEVFKFVFNQLLLLFFLIFGVRMKEVEKFYKS